MPDAKTQPMRAGGQALLEGIMMRSPNSLAIVCRKADGQLIVKEDRWVSLWDRLKFLRKPFLRGAAVLIESMWNGISALTYSANIFAEEEEKKEQAEKERERAAQGAEPEAGTEVKEEKKKKETKPLSPLMMTLTIMASLTFAIGLFVVLPHAATALLGLQVEQVAFHAVDGLIKMLVFVLYIWLISFMPDIRRTFMYHGAEHMVIATFDQGKDLTLENVRPQTTLHPRCGTSFIIVVLLSSILLFSLLFPFMPKFPGMNGILKHLIYIGIKMPLLFPISGISYELIRTAGKYPKNPLLHAAVWPGLMTQKITTRRPTDDMLEVSILSLKKCLWREKQVVDGQEALQGKEQLFTNFAAAVAEIGSPEKHFVGGSCEIQ